MAVLEFETEKDVTLQNEALWLWPSGFIEIDDQLLK